MELHKLEDKIQRDPLRIYPHLPLFMKRKALLRSDYQKLPVYQETKQDYPKGKSLSMDHACQYLFEPYRKAKNLKRVILKNMEKDPHSPYDEVASKNYLFNSTKPQSGFSTLPSSTISQDLTQRIQVFSVFEGKLAQKKEKCLGTTRLTHSRKKPTNLDHKARITKWKFLNSCKEKRLRSTVDNFIAENEEYFASKNSQKRRLSSEIKNLFIVDKKTLKRTKTKSQQSSYAN